MKNNFGADRVFIRKADVAPDITPSGGNVVHPRAALRGRRHWYEEPLSGEPVRASHLVSEIASLLSLMRRQKWVIASITILIATLTLLVVIFLKNEYTATTLVMLDERNSRVLEQNPGSALAADGEVELLKSDNIALKVVKRLGLHEDPDFVPEPSKVKQFIASLITAVSGTAEDHEAAAGMTEWKGALGSDEEAEPSSPALAAALRVFKKEVTVRRRGLTNVIAIEVTDANPRRAAEYSNAYAEVYLEEQVATKLKAIGHAEAGLSRRLSEIDQELKQSETHIGLRQVYQEGLARLKDISQQRETVGPDARIASPARAPDLPSFPNRKLLMLLGTIAGLGLGMGAAYLRDIQTHRVQTEAEVEQITGLPVLATVPKLPHVAPSDLAALPDEVLDRPTSLYSEAIRKLLFTLQAFVDRGKKLGVILVTSADANEGKSAIAASLARTAALAGARVVIVDCNLRHPSLHHTLEVQNQFGFIDLLGATGPENTVVQADSRTASMVISSGNIGAACPEWLLKAERVRETLRILEAEYDVVILDAPPVGLYADALLFANASDIILFPVKSGASKPEPIRSALTQLRRCSEADIFPLLSFSPNS